MLKSKTKKEKYNLFLNIIVGQLIIGTIGLLLTISIPLPDGLNYLTPYILFVFIGITITAYFEIHALERYGTRNNI